MAQRDIFKLYKASASERVQIKPQISHDFLFKSGLIDDSRIRFFLIFYCTITDGRNFLRSLFPDNYFQGRNQYELINQEGMYIHVHTHAKIKKILTPVLKDFFLDDMCFLFGYYAWMIDIELQAGYRKSIEHMETIVQEYEKNKKTGVKTNVTVDTYETFKKRIARNWFELKTTAPEGQENMMLIKVRLFDELYKYFHRVLNEDLFIIISKDRPELSHNETLIMMRKQAQSLKSNSKKIKQIGKIFSLLGLIDYSVSQEVEIYEYMKKFRRNVIAKFYKSVSKQKKS